MKIIRKILLSVSLIIVLSLCNIILRNDSRAETTENKAFELMWSDEFDGTELNKKNWYCKEGKNVNQEKQYYTSSKDNVEVSDGTLKIKAQKVLEEEKEKYGGAEYTSARLEGRNAKTGEILQQVQYGKVEMRAKLPLNNGAWPAFWMVGTTRWKSIESSIDNQYPACGEIDIMEHINYNDYVSGAAHCRTDVNNGIIKRPKSTTWAHSPTISGLDNWHTYSLIKEKNKLSWYIDNIKFKELSWDYINKASLSGFENSELNKDYGGAGNWTKADGKHLINKPFYLILNLACGGSMPENVDDGTGNPADGTYPSIYEIDYVRIYKSINDNTFEVLKGDKKKIASTCNSNISWTSSDENVANIDEEGYIYAKKQGKTTIKAIDENGKCVTSINVIVSDAVINYSTLAETNEDVQATVQFSDANIKIINNNGNNTYNFTENGEFEFEYRDIDGIQKSILAKVDNIDKRAIQGTIHYSKDETTGNVIATLNFDRENVIILNNNGNNQYTFKENGTFTFSYINETGNTGTITAKVEDIKKINSNIYTIDSSNNIKGIQGNTILSEFVNNITTNGTYEIYENGSIVENSNTIVKTGMTVRIDNSEYIIIVEGDIDKNGKVSINDLAKLRKGLMNTEELSEIEKLAGDMDYNDNITINDLAKLRKVILNN